MGRKMAVHSDRKSEQGFSLLEMSILIIVLGILSVPAIQAYNNYRENRDRTETQEALNNTANALAQYFAINGRYPCPADPALPTTNANHGNEVGFGGGLCTTGGTSIVRTTMDWDNDGVTENNPITPGPDTIVIGSVPYVTLQIPLPDSLDARGNKLTYVVTEQMAQTGGGVADTWGAIQVHVQSGTGATTPQITFSPDGPDPDLLPDNDTDGNGFVDTGYFHAVLISHGLNGTGGYSKEGTLLAACPAADADNVGDDENCDNDGNFLFSYSWDVPGANYYDDQMV